MHGGFCDKKFYKQPLIRSIFKLKIYFVFPHKFIKEPILIFMLLML